MRHATLMLMLPQAYQGSVIDFIFEKLNFRVEEMNNYKSIVLTKKAYDKIEKSSLLKKIDDETWERPEIIIEGRYRPLMIFSLKKIHSDEWCVLWIKYGQEKYYEFSPDVSNFRGREIKISAH